MATSTITNNFLVDTFDAPEFSNTAGTPGTYLTSLDINIKKTGYTPIGCSFVNFGHPGSYFVFIAYSSTLAKVHIFRAVSSSVTFPSGDIKIRVVYRKTS